MKLVLAIVNNDDSAIVASALTQEGYFITKLSTTGGFLMIGNTTLLIGAEDDQVENIKKIISEHSSTRTTALKSTSTLGRGLGIQDGEVEASVSGAAVFVLSVDSFEKL